MIGAVQAIAELHDVVSAQTPVAGFLCWAEAPTGLRSRRRSPASPGWAWTNFNTSPNTGTQDILNVQTVLPIHINEDWNVITRTLSSACGDRRRGADPLIRVKAAGQRTCYKEQPVRCSGAQ